MGERVQIRVEVERELCSKKDSFRQTLSVCLLACRSSSIHCILPLLVEQSCSQSYHPTWFCIRALTVDTQGEPILPSTQSLAGLIPASAKCIILA